MLIDAPSIDDPQANKGREYTLTDDNADDFVKMLNRINQ